MNSFQINHQTWYYEIHEEDIQLVLPNSTTLYVSRFVFPYPSITSETLTDFLTRGFNNHILPLPKQKLAPSEKEYFNLWGHLPNFAIHSLNSSFDPLPLAMVSKVEKFASIPVSALPFKNYNREAIEEIKKKNLIPLHHHAIPLYFRYPSSLKPDYTNEQIVLALTEAQLQSCDEIVITNYMPRGDIRKDYLFILEVILCKKGQQ